MRRSLIAALALLVVSLGSATAGLDRAAANGVPQLVKLTYLDGVSNYGPKDAEGVLEFSFAEAYVHVDVKNLKPADGYAFEGWLLGPGTPLFVGKITPNASGIGAMDAKLTGLARFDYDRFVVAARTSATAEGQLPADISIAGRFTVIGDDGSTQSGGDLRPGTLPDTGEKPAMTTRERVGRTVTVACAAAGVALLFLRYWRGRRTLA